VTPAPSARDSLWTYYDRRAPDYDGSVRGAHRYFSELGIDTDIDAIRAERDQVTRQLMNLPAAPFIDIGAGPGVFTGVIPGTAVALDQSDAALRRLRSEIVDVPVLRADATALPLAAHAVVRVFAGHLYGHLEEEERVVFLTEVRRVADELVILDSGRPPGAKAEEWQTRTLPDGTTHTVYKRHFDIDVLLEEVGGEALFSGRYYVLVRSSVR
jgi:SAM-dependent methyltransferase